MEFTYSQIQLLRHATLALVLVSVFAIVGGALMLIPAGAWYIPAATMFGIFSVLGWVRAHDARQTRLA